MRLDRYLRDRLGAEVGRRRIAVLLRDGGVRVNGRVAPKGRLLQGGDEVVVDASRLAIAPLRATPADLRILFCDDDLVAIDKPAGMPSTAGPSAAPSAAGALLERFPDMAAIDPVRAAGLVHRLDTGTSGLLLAARRPEVYRRLRSAFARKIVVKEYLAVVRGQLTAPGRVTRPLRRDRRRRGRMVVGTAHGPGWAAETEYAPLAHAPAFTLVRLRMRTGVTHQLRAHLAHLGHPVLGDNRYGAKNNRAAIEPIAARRDASADELPQGAGWHYLHALRVWCDDPGVLPELATPFPAHWQPLFTQLGWSTQLEARGRT